MTTLDLCSHLLYLRMTVKQGSSRVKIWGVKWIIPRIKKHLGALPSSTFPNECFYITLRWTLEHNTYSNYLAKFFSYRIFFKNVWLLNAKCMILRHQLYLGMSFQLTNEAVSGEAEFGNARVPDVFHQRADFVCFRDVVRCTTVTHKPC